MHFRYILWVQHMNFVVISAKLYTVKWVNQPTFNYVQSTWRCEIYGGRESSTRRNFRKHMQIEKAPANLENRLLQVLQMLTTQTNKETRCKCSQHNQIKYFICSAFLCLVVLWVFADCQIDEVVFLICRCFFLFVVCFFIWLCCEHLQCVCCQIDEVVFLICRCFFYLQRVELSRQP